MDRCLLDTSILSDLIQPTAKRSTVVDSQLAQYLSEWGQISFSHVSCYEVLRGLRKKQAVRQLAQFEVLCQRSELFPVTFAVFDRAAELWSIGQRQGVRVEDADLIIAATALIEGIGVVTANPRHFAWISGLTTANWRQP